MRRSIHVIVLLALAVVTLDLRDPPILAQDQQIADQSSSDQALPQGGAGATETNGLYVVQMADLPVVSYVGGIPGLPATRPPRGQKIDPNSGQVISYVNYLDGRHDQAVRAVGGRKTHDYRYSFNGFAAELSEAQANAMRRQPGVVNVTKDELHTAVTSSTPTFLGLDAAGGLWEQLGGVGSAGEDIIIGVIDSGIWPENPSFSDRTGANGSGNQSGKLSYQQIPGWHGKCTPGEAFPASKCNQKLIGAQRFNAAWGGDAGLKDQRPWEYASPRDFHGHGTHTASTAGGNNGIQPTGPASVFGRISGMAPRARIAAYKGLWSNQDASQASGFTSDLVEAIDQAVADGVDVINYSISGTLTNFLNAAQVAFLFAADAGVFVAAAAGNEGPATGTVNHPSPWVATVAAGTHNRTGNGSVTLGNGATYNGASIATAVGPAPFIDSTTAGLPGADPTEVALCYAAADNGGVPVLDPAKVAGKIVLCDRGVTARVAKSQAVGEAGGLGMILVNTSANSLNADFHFVPSVHLSHLDRPAVKAYAATAGATATINQATIVFDTPAPLTAAFSSRGPLQAGGGDLLKPDIMAPGQDILAAISPRRGGRDFDLLSGTSMSAPHVAGLAALLKDLHPDWTPMMIKSALMTSATDVLDGGTPPPNTNPVLIFRQGAGHVAPTSAADPGLVYDATFDDWLAFLCGATAGVQPSACAALVAAGYSLDPSDLNVASIAIGDLVGTQTVRRKVTNVNGAAATYNAAVTGMTGFNVTITPSSLSLGAGETKSFTVTFTRTTATLNAYTGGQLTWSDGTHRVRSPIVVRPVALSAPTAVSGTGAPINYNIGFGYTGTFTATPRGLVPAVRSNGTVTDDPDDTFTVGDPAGTTTFPITIQAGTTYARFSLFDANVSPPSDLDLYVTRNTDNAVVASSGGATSQEEANILNPAAGEYTVHVHGFAVNGTATFTLFHWLVGSTSAGNMIVTAPPAATSGTAGVINLTFSGLAAAEKYLGSVAYGGTSGLPNPTIVRIDTP